MTSHPSEDFVRRSLRLSEQQIELAKAWLDGDAKLSGACGIADDHVVPRPRRRSGQGRPDYSELGLPGGHVGVFVGGKSQGLLGSGIVDWLAKRGS